MQIFRSQLWQTLTKVLLGLGILGSASIANAQTKQELVKAGSLGALRTTSSFSRAR